MHNYSWTDTMYRSVYTPNYKIELGGIPVIPLIDGIEPILV